MQAKVSYVDFRDSYIHTTSLTYDEPVQEMIDDQQAEVKVDVTIASKEKEKDKKKEKTIAYTFTIGLENDQMKILSYETDE